MNPRARNRGEETAYQKKMKKFFDRVEGYLELYKETKKKMKEDSLSKVIYENSLRSIAKELNKAKILVDKLKFQGEISPYHEEKYKSILNRLSRYCNESSGYLDEPVTKEENLPDIGLTPIAPLNNPILKVYDINKGYEVIGAISAGMSFDEVAQKTGIPIEVFISWTLRISDFKKMFYNALYLRSWVLAERMKTLADHCPAESDVIKKVKLQTDVYRFLISHYAPKEWGENELLRQAMMSSQQEEAGIGSVQIILPSNGRDVELKKVKELSNIDEVDEFQGLVMETRDSESLIDLSQEIGEPDEFNRE